MVRERRPQIADAWEVRHFRKRIPELAIAASQPGAEDSEPYAILEPREDRHLNY